MSPHSVEIANLEINAFIDTCLTSPSIIAALIYLMFVSEFSKAMKSPLQAGAKKRTKRRGRRLTGVSRQRRVANTRERNRVHILNETIDKLRDLIPLFPGEKRPSKTETIRLAALYIEHMTEILESTRPSRQETVSKVEVIVNDLPKVDLLQDLDPEGVLDLEDLEIELLSDDVWLTNSLESEFTAGGWLSL